MMSPEAVQAFDDLVVKVSHDLHPYSDIVGGSLWNAEPVVDQDGRRWNAHVDLHYAGADPELDGAKLSFHALDYPDSQKGRMSVSVIWPRAEDGTYQGLTGWVQSPENYDELKGVDSSISVSMTRPSSDLAKDINRRLITLILLKWWPQVVVAVARDKAKRDEMDDVEAGLEQMATELDLTYQVYSWKNPARAQRREYSIGRVGFEVDNFGEAPRVDNVKADNITLDQLRQVLDLLG